MQSLLILGLYVSSGFLFLLVILGLFKPWAVLWWEDTQNRLKVITYYGIPATAFWGIGKLLEIILS